MCLVAQLCLILCKPLDCGLPGSSAHGISQATILEWVAISFFRESFQPRDWTHISCGSGKLAGGFFNHRATWEAQTATICYNRHLVFYRYIYMSHKYRSCINAEWPKVLHFFITDRFNMLSDLTNTLTNVYLLRHILTRYFPPHSQISQ